MKTCNACNKVKSIDSFGVYNRAKDGIRGTCKSCRNKASKINKSWRPSYIQREYGITVEEYEKRMNTSKCCELCGVTTNLVYDHCHDTMKFRGVLCSQCNMKIGALGDTVESITKVLTYLNKGIK